MQANISRFKVFADNTCTCTTYLVQSNMSKLVLVLIENVILPQTFLLLLEISIVTSCDVRAWLDVFLLSIVYTRNGIGSAIL